MMTTRGLRDRTARLTQALSLAAIAVTAACVVMPTASTAEDHAPKPVAAAAQHDTSAWATSVSVHSDNAAEANTKPGGASKAKPATPAATKAAAAAPVPATKPQVTLEAAAPVAETKPAPAPAHAPDEAAKPIVTAPPAPPAAAHAPAPAARVVPAPESPAPAPAPTRAVVAPEPVAVSADGKGKETVSKAVEKPVHSYCVNITNTALDARYLRQKKFLDDLKEDVKKRTGELENTIATYKEWLKRRDEFVSKAQDSLVAIYGNMKSEAAAKQLTELEEETASSVLAKLDARQSSAIMAEMDSKKAARLMEIIAGAGKFSPGGDATPPEPMKQASTEADAPEADLGVQ